ncbi:hypothetical protein DC094_16175 [Pelagibaculum spongiae]|uniref:Uncharacterized protein n=1 Tax=Pelagibaculum spongiae TaxID=2080658 RepID=A0A2V1GS55_9GAMM|nr:hypothetical protein DC094_16175 [Pelagibaculum spongiae]
MALPHSNLSKAQNWPPSVSVHKIVLENLSGQTSQVIHQLFIFDSSISSHSICTGYIHSKFMVNYANS